MVGAPALRHRRYPGTPGLPGTAAGDGVVSQRSGACLLRGQGSLTVPKMGVIVPIMGIQRAATPVSVSVADALFSKTRQRVLAVLFGNANRSFYANEIIRLADSGTGAVQRELASLQAAGLVTVTRVGNQKHFQANASDAVFGPLRELVLKTSGLGDVLRAGLANVAANVHAAFVYGSVAKRTDTSTSDIDLMVISDALAYGDVFSALEQASATLGRSINPTVYTRAELAKRRAAGNAFVVRVLAQRKIWILGGDADLAA